MAFLDNSGDIILDAVLTDTGRARLAKGDGTFKISKFALADDEVDYENYNGTHPSGSAYYDLQILQTPVLEAFTNNASSMKHKLVSIPRTNLLYLPVVRLNETFEASTGTVASGGSASTTLSRAAGMFIVAVDKATEDAVYTIDPTGTGVLKGENTSGGSYVRVDQGLDTTGISPEFLLDADLVETQYIVEIDNRFGNIVSQVNGSQAAVSYIDDDSIASYYFSLGTDLDYVSENSSREESSTQVIKGPRGTLLKLRVQSSLELMTSKYLFEQLGGLQTWDVDYVDGAGVTKTHSFRFLDSTLRISGATTGYSVDIPLRFAKKIN